MINVTVDSTNVFGKFVEESGRYNVTILPTSKASTTKSGGDDMATLNFEVLDGDYAGGQIRYNNITWKDDTQANLEISVKRFNTILVAIGLEDGKHLSCSMEQLVQSLVGKELNISTEWEKNIKGNYNLNVTAYRPIDPEGSKPDGTKRPDISATQAATAPASSPSAPYTGMVDPFAQPAPGQPEITDDDLPF